MQVVLVAKFYETAKTTLTYPRVRSVSVTDTNKGTRADLISNTGEFVSINRVVSLLIDGEEIIKE